MWKGYDRPDVGSLTAAPDTPAGQKPFRMVGEGVGRIVAVSYKDRRKRRNSRQFLDARRRSYSRIL